jgi:predicted DNA-binding protein
MEKDKTSEQIAFRLTQHEKQVLSQKATAEGKTPSQVMRSLVQKYIAEYENNDVNQRLEALEKKITELQRANLGEFLASETKITC